MNAKVEGRVQALREEAARLRAQAERFAEQGLPWAAAVCMYEAERNDEAARLEAGGEPPDDETVQLVGRPAITERPIATATVTIVPAEVTVPWYLPVLVLVALLIVAAGLGLLAAHIVHGGL